MTDCCGVDDDDGRSSHHDVLLFPTHHHGGHGSGDARARNGHDGSRYSWVGSDDDEPVGEDVRVVAAVGGAEEVAAVAHEAVRGVAEARSCCMVENSSGGVRREGTQAQVRMVQHRNAWD